jgi:hypothetical protein
MGLAALAAAAVLAYPLWVQFFGPGAGRGLPSAVVEYGADLAAYPAYARQTLAGHAAVSEKLAQGPTEEGSFYGWPLLLVAAAATCWLWRNALARAAAIIGLTFAVLSLGPHLRLRGAATTIALPWDLINELPLFDSVVPTRMSLVVTVTIGVLLALALDRAARSWETRLPWLVAVAAALLPLTPVPLPTQPRPATPVFFTSGSAPRELGRDATVVPVPVGWNEYLNAMQWQIDAGLTYTTVGGYFLAPKPGDPTRRNTLGPEYRPTALLWYGVEYTDQAAEVTDERRAQALADLRYWHATAILLPQDAPAAEALRLTTDHLVGREARRVDDVWIWDVRDIGRP